MRHASRIRQGILVSKYTWFWVNLSQLQISNKLSKQFKHLFLHLMNHKSFLKDASSFDWTYLTNSDPVCVSSPRWQPVALEPCDPGSMLGFFQLLPGRFNGKRRSYITQTTQKLGKPMIWIISLQVCFTFFVLLLLLQTNVNRTYLQSWDRNCEYEKLSEMEVPLLKCAWCFYWWMDEGGVIDVEHS